MKQRLLTLGVIAAVLSLSACMKEADSSAGLSDNALSARIGQSSVSNQNGDLNDGVLSLRNRESLVHSHMVDGQLVHDVVLRAENDPNAVGGLLWARFTTDGNVIDGVSSRGTSCNSCHKAALNQ
ncbi:MAG: hypothetical protein ACO1G7_10845 [Bacteroidota bacterium]|jgi:hypothetical protein|uniref:hypothetical protein n=1 Tax=Candidatus Pollutiaquabacter sp. TaxID=3416354 RepID=UPI001B6D5837|nr:hypothetical protein [Bacteroidota bacterium]MBP7269684.1 hypothetical protein [Bacteroidia bacterium]MBP7437390.1 hypothetical protein [Bacteroidia bacterium]MBP7728795.1 hypothetical protein [Bacteroidia bacterium]MBP7772718.1 hypothetical protein [Bacteroidia bacterium]